MREPISLISEIIENFGVNSKSMVLLLSNDNFNFFAGDFREMFDYSQHQISIILHILHYIKKCVESNKHFKTDNRKNILLLNLLVKKTDIKIPVCSLYGTSKSKFLNFVDHENRSTLQMIEETTRLIKFRKDDCFIFNIFASIFFYKDRNFFDGEFDGDFLMDFIKEKKHITDRELIIILNSFVSYSIDGGYDVSKKLGDNHHIVSNSKKLKKLISFFINDKGIEYFFENIFKVCYRDGLQGFFIKDNKMVIHETNLYVFDKNFIMENLNYFDISNVSNF